jgi:membrane protease YdiL (CAAX protease family)
MEPHNLEEIVQQKTVFTCASCQREVREGSTFCGYCGKQLANKSNEDVKELNQLFPTLAYYFITIVLLSVYKFTPVFDQSFRDHAIVTAIDVCIVVFFAVFYWKMLLPLFAIKRINAGILLGVICLAVAAAVVVNYTGELINIALFNDSYYSLPLFESTSYPFVFATLFICVQPAIFEEIAFRGFLFNNISQLTSPKATIYITAFLFGIMHLAFVSLLWLVPLGLAFAYLRERYHTLWYGIVGHFVYNFTILLLEYYVLYQP